MKKIPLFILAFFLTIFVVNAQAFKDLQGPAAKNYKPWKDNSKKTTAMVNVTPNEKQGPAFKNAKAWEMETEKVALVSRPVSDEREFGPKAKNRQPWKND
ncbi:hypothetical protein [Cognataquiflexum aquatile]|jgi:hypothetical protein|uniref:hypothetical protein n=1 Tax=Cognataquiflexum aquatile TaxID=2249427 RepID=UPI000DEACF0B|nr:hypothetical protein [Cognataquiflexum aquatile]